MSTTSATTERVKRPSIQTSKLSGPDANGHVDWQCSVDKSELVKVFEGYHPDLLAVME